MNELLKENGFIRTDGKGHVIDCDCYAHSACLTSFIELANPEDEKMKKKVRDFLEGLKQDKAIQLLYVLDKEEMKDQYFCRLLKNNIKTLHICVPKELKISILGEENE